MCVAGIPHLVKAGSNPKLHGAASALTQHLFLLGVFQAGMGEQGNTRREIMKNDGEYSQRSLRGCCETKARVLGWARSFAEGGGSRAGGARGGCSHLPPGLASSSAGSEGR